MLMHVLQGAWALVHVDTAVGTSLVGLVLSLLNNILLSNYEMQLAFIGLCIDSIEFVGARG